MREGSLQVSELLLLGKSSPDRGNSRCKGPEAGVCLIQYLATSGASIVGRAGNLRSCSFGEDQRLGSAPSPSASWSGGEAKAQTKATGMMGNREGVVDLRNPPSHWGIPLLLGLLT